MDLLTNALDAIRVGVADYQDGSRPRLLSAMRNIHSGILLMYKEALRRKSPTGSNDVFVMASAVLQADALGNPRLVGTGKKTASTRQIRKRFTNLGITTEWARFDGIAVVRNAIEHHYVSASQQSLQGVVASAFAIVRSFAIEELKTDPQLLLGIDTWKAMVAVADVYDAERNECDEALAAVDWRSAALEKGVRQVRCASCSSDLLQPAEATRSYEDVVLRCRVCGHQHEPHVFVPFGVKEALAWEAYVAMEDGADAPVAACPECGTETYVIDEDRCALCGESAERDCVGCGHAIPASELGLSPLCSWCSNRFSKDD